ncbi:hypothetical protein COTS27_01295 [Spirochaetota bacterium]|nr:hypothetical protein COTS27_01295 [Spirochaetota bacterium]
MKLTQYPLFQKLSLVRNKSSHVSKKIKELKKLLPYLLAVVFITSGLLTACASSQPLTKKTSKQAASKKATKTTTIAAIGDGSIEDVRASFRSGNFNRVLQLTKGNPDPNFKYYRGATFFAMMGYKHRFPAKKLIQYRDQAIALLTEVINETEDGELMNRARLWLGVSYDVSYPQRSYKIRALKWLKAVEKDADHREKFYNEAVLYQGDVYARIGNYIKAREYYRKLANSPYPNDIVYDHANRRFSSVNKATKDAYARLKLYLDGTHPDYKPVKDL